MSKAYNKHLVELLRLSREMMVLADLGDRDREDGSCGVLYGMLRDAAYKLRKEAEKEKKLHQENGFWDMDDKITTESDGLSDF